MARPESATRRHDVVLSRSPAEPICLRCRRCQQTSIQQDSATPTTNSAAKQAKLAQAFVIVSWKLNTRCMLFGSDVERADFYAFF